MNPHKKLLEKLDFKNTNWAQFDWETLGVDFKNFDDLDLEGLSSEEVGKLKSLYGMWMIYGQQRGSPKSSYEPLKKPPFKIKELDKTKRQSRSGRTYYYSAVFRNAVVLQLLVWKYTSWLRETARNRPGPSWQFNRLIDQMDSEARSVVANVREGYGRPTTVEYATFLGYSKGSLEELRGDVIDSKDRGLLKSVPGSSLESLGIKLRPPQNAPSSYDHLRELKRVIRGIKSEKLTFEIFMELVNKTDYLLRRTVEGLREKIIKEAKQELKDCLEAIWSKYWG